MNILIRINRAFFILLIPIIAIGTFSRISQAGLCKGVSDLGNNHFKIDSKTVGTALKDNQTFDPTVGGKKADTINTLYAKHLTVLEDGEGCICLFWFPFAGCIADWCNGPWAKWRIAVAPNGTKLGSMQDGDGQFEPAIDSLPIKNFTQLNGPFLSDSGSCEWWEVDEHGNDGEDPIGIQYGHYINNPLWDWDNFCFNQGCYNSLEILIYESDDCWGPFCLSDDVRIYFTIDKSIQLGSAKNEKTEFILEVPFQVDPNKVDTDGDGITDVDEKNKYNTDPKKADTDGDGINDGLEIKSYNTNPNDADTDSDGLNDGLEINTYNTSAKNSDTDGDGVNDGDEIKKYKTNPKDANADADGDGIKDSTEILKYGTSPTSSDTDGDGLSDPDEINKYKTKPNDWDTDDDGRSDGEEIKVGKDPFCPNPKLNASQLPPLPSGCPPYNIQPNIAKPMDLDGDGRGDLISFSGDRKWYIDLSYSGPTQFKGMTFPKGKPKDNFGWWDLVFDLSKDSSIAKDAMLFPVVMDYNTDGKVDLALYDAVHGKWYVSFTNGNTLNTKATDVNGNLPFSGWDLVIDYSSQPLWKPFSRPVPGSYNGQDDDLTTQDHFMDIALQTPDGWWMIDYGGKDKNNYGKFDETIHYLTDDQLADAPAWAWLPAVYLSAPDNKWTNGIELVIKTPDNLPDKTKSNKIMIWDHNKKALYDLSSNNYGDNDMIFMQAKFQVHNMTDLGIKQLYPTYSIWMVATKQSDWLDTIYIDPYVNYGDINCRAIPADYDGDGYEDRAVQCANKWMIAYTGSTYPINFNQITTILINGEQKKASQTFRVIEEPITNAPLPGYVYPGGITFKETKEIFKALDYLCPTANPNYSPQPCTLLNMQPTPISPYFPQCIDAIKKQYASDPCLDPTKKIACEMMIVKKAGCAMSY